MLRHDLETYRRRFESFGWNAMVVDGHDVKEIAEAYDKALATTDRPTALIAKTYKGHDFPGIADLDNWHGKALGDKTAAVVDHLKGLLKNAKPIAPKTPGDRLAGLKPATIKLDPPAYKKGDKIATRVAYGSAIARLAKADRRVVALDGDTKNSTYSEKIKTVDPNRYVECFIAEQNLVGVTVGMATRGKIAFCSTFATFFTRAFDQIRMAAISQSKAKFVGSHVGVSIGEDGPSQMGLEDIAMFRTVPGCVVFYPSDAVSAEQALLLAANYDGMAFVRTSRPATPVIYDNAESFKIGEAKVVRKSANDKLTIVAAGVTLDESMKAAEVLAKAGVNVRVIDPFTIKPLDRATILKNAKETGSLVLTVEDHYPEGGIGDAVAGELADDGTVRVVKMAVREIPRSGKPEELVAKYGIDSNAIVAKVKSLV
jgi:transketolase